MSMSYSEYLELDDLLSLQRPRSTGPAHDELLFIVIHQTYELWFKQVLFELDQVGSRFDGDEIDEARWSLRRVVTILKTLVGQFDILETMSPLGFAEFRGALGASSGFQSAQFRELELLLGDKRTAPLETFAEGSEPRQRLDKRLAEPSLWDRFVKLLVRRGHQLPQAYLERDPRLPAPPSAELRDLLVAVVRDGGGLAQLCEQLLDLDEGLQEWRYRHAKMVERMIGDMGGTGGSAGAAYLRSTLFKPCFAELWEIRSRLGDSDQQR